MNHEIEVSNLMFNKTSDEPVDFEKYDINVELEEESSNDEKTVLKYSLDLTSNPKNSVINISGNTILNGDQSEIEELLKQENEKTPEIVSLIYQELFPLMYIISKNMKIPSPAHTISQNNFKDTDKTQNQIENPSKNQDDSSKENLTQNENEMNSQEDQPKENVEANNAETNVEKAENNNSES